MDSYLGFILERVEYDNYERLIEEGKDPIELLHYKFQNVPTEIIDEVISIDPTKKKSYSQWLLSHWDDESNTIVTNLKNGRIAKLFQHYKEHNDIQIKDCPSVEEGLMRFVPEEDTVLVKSDNPTTTLMNNGWTKEVPSELANDFDIVFNADDWVIAVPNTYEADCKLGENMNWCTAGGRTDFNGGRSYFDHYLSQSGGKYYVNFDLSEGESRLGKDYPFTRYQFHFESNQFMDKEDDPVELSEIGMPDSAKEFYSDEGYDTSQFENIDARMERYEEQRYNCGYRINDDLSLYIAYDDDYEFRGEPDEDTDFYVYDDNNDTRDPICWDEIANPRAVGADNVILLNDENLVILKKKYGEENAVVVLAKDEKRSQWRDWSSETFDKYMVIGGNFGVFGISNKTIKFFSSRGNYELNIGITDIDNMFVNKACSDADDGKWDRIFIETVEGEYHSLFAFSIVSSMVDDFECLIRRDVPSNHESYLINEQGIIEGEFRNYRVYDDKYYGGKDLSAQYQLEDKLPTGDYLIYVDKTNEYGSKKREFNILKRSMLAQGGNEPLIDVWFDKYIGNANNVYGICKKNKAEDKNTRLASYNNNVGFFSVADGHQVGRWYDSYSGIDRGNGIILGNIDNNYSPSQVDIINCIEGNVVATFKNIISAKAVNNKIVVIDNNEESKVFDYAEGAFYFPALGNFNAIGGHDHPYLFECNFDGTEEKVLFNLASQRILVRGIDMLSQLERYDSDYLRLLKMNGKVNVFDAINNVEMLPHDVDGLNGINTYAHVLVYVENGKCYPLNYKTNKIMINPNGISMPTLVGTSTNIVCQTDNYNIYFVPEGNNYTFYKWQSKKSYIDYGTNFDPQNTPQEVLNAYGLIFGEQSQQQQSPQEQEAYAVAEEFKRFLKRIDEASKRRYNELVD